MILSFNLCAAHFFQIATQLILCIKLLGPNYLINGTAMYFFWPKGLSETIPETP